MTFEREGSTLRIGLSPTGGAMNWHLRSDAPGTKTDKGSQIGLLLPLPEIELGDSLHESALAGSRTSQFRILHEAWSSNKVVITAEGLAGTSGNLPVLRHKLVRVHPAGVADGLSAEADDSHPGVSLSGIDTAFRDPNLPLALEFHFPPGEGWKTITVTLTW